MRLSYNYLIIKAKKRNCLHLDFCIFVWQEAINCWNTWLVRVTA